MTELPIACSLSAGDLEARQAELAAVGRRSLISVARAEGAAVLNFKKGPGTRSELERIVAAEAECCAFLEMNVREGDSLTLTIDGPEGAGPVVEELVEAIASQAGI
jgi:hypothetical protein